MWPTLCVVEVWDTTGPEPICTHTVSHPDTVWHVSTLPNGDVVVGCADKRGYVWSLDEARAAPVEVQEAFQERVEAAPPAGGQHSATGAQLRRKLQARKKKKKAAEAQELSPEDHEAAAAAAEAAQAALLAELELEDSTAKGQGGAKKKNNVNKNKKKK